MRAVVARSFGGPEVLDVVTVPTPDPGPGQVRVKVVAASVNPVDLVTRDGTLAGAGMMANREMIGLGWDVAGVVDRLGDGVGTLREGAAVIGLSDRLDTPGTQAEYVVLDAADVTAAPRDVSLVAAATLPLNGLTAAQALDLLALEPGQTVLVTGAAGGVGGYAVELATAQGLRVVAVADADDRDLVLGFGAEIVILRSANVAEAVRHAVPGGVDGALDAATLGIRALDAVRGAGAYVGVIRGAEPMPLRGIRVSTVLVRSDGERLAALARLVEQGKLTLRVADTLPFTGVADAHRRLARSGLRGRLVLTPVSGEGPARP